MRFLELLCSLAIIAAGSTTAVAAFTIPPCPSYRIYRQASRACGAKPCASDMHMNMLLSSRRTSINQIVGDRAAQKFVRRSTSSRSRSSSGRSSRSRVRTAIHSRRSSRKSTADDWLSSVDSVTTKGEGEGKEEEVQHRITSGKPTQDETAVATLLPLALLNGVTVLWGTQHAVIKLILQEDLSPGITNFTRFGIAALLFLPWAPGVGDLPSIPEIVADVQGGSSKTAAAAEAASGVVEGRGLGYDDGSVGNGVRDTGGDIVGAGAGSGVAGAEETWRAGAELGIWMFLGFAFQSIGLGFTTASRSAFLLYLNVKLVPFLGFVLEGRSISTPTWISAFLAFAGTVLLSSDGTPPNVGDLWSVLAAATSAMFILRLEKYSARCDPSRLNSANLCITALLCGAWAGWEITTRGTDVSVALEAVRSQAGLIGYLAVVTTALTNWMQAVGQRSVPAERAAVIYAMDPVYAAGFAYLLLGETLGPTGVLGAGIITGAALWSQGMQVSAPDDGGRRDGESDIGEG